MAVTFMIGLHKRGCYAVFLFVFSNIIQFHICFTIFNILQISVRKAVD